MSIHLPELPELPVMTSGDTAGLRLAERISRALPDKQSAGPMKTLRSGRKREAEEYAAAMGNAFATTRAQVHRNEIIARAKGKAQQRLAER